MCNWAADTGHAGTALINLRHDVVLNSIYVSKSISFVWFEKMINFIRGNIHIAMDNYKILCCHFHKCVIIPKYEEKSGCGVDIKTEIEWTITVSIQLEDGAFLISRLTTNN